MKPAQDLASGAEDRGVIVEIWENRRAGNDSESRERRLEVRFGPRRINRVSETLTLSGLPPINASLSYVSDEGSVSCMLLQSGDLLLDVLILGPSNSFVTLRLSPDVSIALIITHGVRIN